MTTHFINNTEYTTLLEDIKQRYRSAQLKAAFAVNHEMIQFYWSLGKQIIEKQSKTNWGSKFLKQLSQDLRNHFPSTKGFSLSNLKYIRKFAELYPTIGQQAAGQLPWGHIMVLLDKVKDSVARDWYAESALKNGTARSVLEIQIEQNLYERQGKLEHKITNFANRLPVPQSDMALQLFKDPYDFRFLPVTEEAEEQAIEHSLTTHLRKLFLELGTGFAFMGNQYKISVDGHDFFLDLLFYHVRLRCYFVVELKTTEFKPEHVGQLNFYLAVVDGALKEPEDNPTIGLLLCKKKNKLVAEYSLKRIEGPIGIADYRLLQELPKELINDLPSPAMLERQLEEGRSV